MGDRPTDAAIQQAKKVMRRVLRADAEAEQRAIDERVKGDVWWCSEGCGLVDRHHRCEQWCDLTHIPKEAVIAIKGKGDE